jgi:hypothetical protein
MKAGVSKFRHRIGIIRVSAYRSEAAQREALEARGCKRAIFSSEDGEGVAEALLASRHGDEIVVHGVAALGTSRADGEAALLAFRKKGCVVYDTETSSVVSEIGVEAWATATREWNREQRLPTPEIARQRGKKGGKKGVWRVTQAEAERIWNDPALSDVQKAYRIGLSIRSCYRSLERRNLPAGRKPKDGKR